MSPAAYRLLTAFCVLGVALSSDDSAKQRTIIEGPLNDVVIVGDTVILHCQVSGPSEVVQWSEYISTPAGNPISSNTQILPGHPNAARYSIAYDAASRSYDLVIDRTVLGDGGAYGCLDTSTLSRPAFAQIVAIEDFANCSTNIPENGFVVEGVYYSIECTIYYGGIGPNITWTGPPDTTGFPWNSTFYYANGHVWSGVGMFMSRFFGGYSFEANVGFSGEGFVGQQDQADNIPTYGYTISYPQLYVRWAPGNMYVTPEGPYEIGEEILCWADSNPGSTYQWQNTVTNEVTQGQMLVVTAQLVGTTPFRCNANNGIGQQTLNIDIVVNPVTTPTTPATTTTTTLPPAEGACNDLTGRWGATSPSKVDLCLEIDYDFQGQIIGLFRNATDPYFIEVRGRMQLDKNDELAFVGVWPVNIGTQAFTGVCTNCHGVEYLQISAAGRKITDFDTCSDFGQIYYTSFYEFTRTGGPCRNLFKEYGIEV